MNLRSMIGSLRVELFNPTYRQFNMYNSLSLILLLCLLLTYNNLQHAFVGWHANNFFYTPQT